MYVDHSTSSFEMVRLTPQRKGAYKSSPNQHQVLQQLAVASTIKDSRQGLTHTLSATNKSIKKSMSRAEVSDKFLCVAATRERLQSRPIQQSPSDMIMRPFAASPRRLSAPTWSASCCSRETSTNTGVFLAKLLHIAARWSPGFIRPCTGCMERI